MSKGLTFLLYVVLISGSRIVAGDAGNEVNFSLPQLGGGEVSLAEFRGQWLVINYWATWCAPCRKEIPELVKLHEERGDVTVLGLAFEDIDDSAFEKFLTEINVTYPILRVDVYDPPEPFGTPKALPTTYLLDPTGRTAKEFVGPITRQQLEQFIDAQNLGSTD